MDGDKKDQSQMEIVKMKVLTCVVDYFLLSEKISKSIREELESYTLNEQIQQCRNHWLSNTEHMDQHFLMRQAWEYCPRRNHLLDQGRDRKFGAGSSLNLILYS
jgi:hypothetical protein